VLAIFSDQHIGQDGQGMPAFNDTGHGLKGCQHLFLLSLEYDHEACSFWSSLFLQLKE
jgi:hypothetical protein